MQPARESGRAGRIPCPLASRLRLGWEEGMYPSRHIGPSPVTRLPRLTAPISCCLTFLVCSPYTACGATRGGNSAQPVSLANRSFAGGRKQHLLQTLEAPVVPPPKLAIGLIAQGVRRSGRRLSTDGSRWRPWLQNCSVFPTPNRSDHISLQVCMPGWPYIMSSSGKGHQGTTTLAFARFVV